MNTDRRQQEPRRVDEPEPGFYRSKLVQGGPWVGVSVERDDVGDWHVTVDGIERERSRDPWTIPWLRDRYHYADRIKEAEHAYLVATSAWAREHNPDHPAANPRQPIRPTTFKSLF